VAFLLLATALHEGSGEDLRSCDERAADSEARPAQLLGGDHHGDVLVVAALAVAAVLAWDAQAEGAELSESGNDLLGDVGVGAVNMLGVRCHHIGGERSEGVAHHVHVVAQVEGAWSRGEGGEELGVAVSGHEVVRGFENTGLDTPL